MLAPFARDTTMMRPIATAILILLASGATAAPPKAEDHEKSADPGSKMICKRFIETGSLIKGYRSCKTKREWEHERDNARGVNNTNSCGTLGNGGVCG
jgi:hypothetical protein